MVLTDDGAASFIFLHCSSFCSVSLLMKMLKTTRNDLKDSVSTRNIGFESPPESYDLAERTVTRSKQNREVLPSSFPGK